MSLPISHSHFLSYKPLNLSGNVVGALNCIQPVLGLVLLSGSEHKNERFSLMLPDCECECTVVKNPTVATLFFLSRDYDKTYGDWRLIAVPFR